MDAENGAAHGTSPRLRLRACSHARRPVTRRSLSAAAPARPLRMADAPLHFLQRAGEFVSAAADVTKAAFAAIGPGETNDRLADAVDGDRVVIVVEDDPQHRVVRTGEGVVV